MSDIENNIIFVSNRARAIERGYVSEHARFDARVFGWIEKDGEEPSLANLAHYSSLILAEYESSDDDLE